jgi:hypothetical protein
MRTAPYCVTVTTHTTNTVTGWETPERALMQAAMLHAARKGHEHLGWWACDVKQRTGRDKWRTIQKFSVGRVVL